ncbi:MULTISPECIES: hypothetical protein [unclassified Streptomyces]|uniref:hypothetical protein n=1 Tax=unclassified Streptomyces TaxID=2593676 RepID=UPI00226F60BB|nr:MULTISPECIES: hypothetical protein [unclassified Streptomyces]MCY0923498.1 hypothetical protein [Streptomyces sp. H27-G5]MCY0962517.1 hypothetical protein [Streptomyces sp. H27-H5]
MAHRGIRDTAISAAIYTSTPAAPEAAPRPRAGITRLGTPPGRDGGSMPAPSRIRPTSGPDLATRIPSTPLSTPTPRTTPSPRPAPAAPATSGSFMTEATPRPEPIRPRPTTPSPYSSAPTGDARPTPYPAPESRADNASNANADRLRRRFQEQADTARRRREADRTGGGDQ